MYSWGDDTSTWKKPKAYDYGSARKPYLDDLAKEADANGPRTYASKKGPNLQFVDPMGKTISTDSTNPLVWLVDGTGSMQTALRRVCCAQQRVPRYRSGAYAAHPTWSGSNLYLRTQLNHPVQWQVEEAQVAVGIL